MSSPAVVMRRVPGRLLFALLPGVLLLAAQPVQAQRVRAYVSADSVRVGDRFVLSVTLTHDPRTEPVFPAATDSLRFGDLEVLAERRRDRYDRGGARVDSVVYEVTTFALDSAFVPPIPIHLSADADTFTVASPAFVVPVVSLVPPDAQEPRDLAPLVAFPRAIWPWVLLVLAVLLVAAWLGYRYWQKRKARAEAPEPVAPARVLSPYEEAAEHLDALESYDLYAPEATKPYYVELSDTVRHYLARRTGINAMECTTRELIRELSRRTAVPPEGVDRTRAILDLADYVKYADAHPPVERSRAVLGETREVIDRIERALRRLEKVEVRSAGEEVENVSPA